MNKILFLSILTWLIGSAFNSIPLNTYNNTPPKTGKELFKRHCANCHNKNMKDDLKGPALAGVEKRWSNYPKKDLYEWIRSPKAMLEKQHPKAIEIWLEWDKARMSASKKLTDEDIEAILEYIRSVE